MRSIHFDTDDGLFEGTLMVYVHDTKHLNHLVKNLKNIKGVSTVDRIGQ
jgi:GTP pyrophosphokinase